MPKHKPAPDDVRCEALVRGHRGWNPPHDTDHRCGRRANQMRGLRHAWASETIRVCFQTRRSKGNSQMATLTPAQREVAQLHATVLEAASSNMQRIAHGADLGHDPVLRHIDAKTMQSMSSAAMIIAMAYRRAINGALEVES